MEAEKRAEFVKLFQEFVNSYPYTPDRLRHIALARSSVSRGVEILKRSLLLLSLEKM